MPRWGAPPAWPSFADVADQFAHKAVARYRRRRPDTGAIKGGGVLHNHNVDVIEHAQFDKLLFAAQEPDLSSLFQLVAVFDLHVLLSGDSHQHNVAGEFFHNAGAGEGIADANQARHTSQLWPQEWAAPVFFVGAAVAGATTASISPMTATRILDSLLLQGATTPVMASHPGICSPSHQRPFDLFRGFELLVAQLGSLKMESPRATILSRFLSMASHALLEFLFGYRHNLNLLPILSV